MKIILYTTTEKNVESVKICFCVVIAKNVEIAKMCFCVATVRRDTFVRNVAIGIDSSCVNVQKISQTYTTYP